MQFAYTRAVAALTDDGIFDVVRTAAYTVDPFIEELVKVAPLVVAGLVPRIRRQWGLTDYLLLGAAIGAGFGLLEAVARFGDEAERAIRTQSGWVMPIGLGSPFVPDFNTALGSWLSAPVSIEDLGIPDGRDVFLHLAWSAVAGFGIGVLFRVQAWWRVVGLVPLLLVGIDHASFNYEIAVQEPSGFGDVVTTPFIAVQDLLGLWPLLALVVAVAVDHRSLRRQLGIHDDLLLAADGAVRGPTPS